jgi:hypothetical protein
MSDIFKINIATVLLAGGLGTIRKLFLIETTETFLFFLLLTFTRKTKIKLGRKGMTGTNTMAYYAHL